MKRPDYQPGQRVITFTGKGFDQPTPRLAWVAAGFGYGCVTWAETHWEVTVSHDETDLRYGTHVNVAKVKPFTPELWAACEGWIKRRIQLATDLDALTRQRIPQVAGKPVIAPWQDLLFLQETICK